MSAGVAGRPLDGCDLCISSCAWSSSCIVLIAPEAARWHDGDQFVEVEIDDRLQCLAGSALLKVFRQSLEPLRVLALQDDEFGDGIAPALSAAAPVCRWPVMVHRPGCGTSGAMPGLSLGIGQRSVAEGLARHGLTPKRYVTERDGGFGRDYGRSGAMFEAPALVAGVDDFAVGGSGDRAVRWSYRIKQRRFSAPSAY